MFKFLSGLTVGLVIFDLSRKSVIMKSHGRDDLFLFTFLLVAWGIGSLTHFFYKKKDKEDQETNQLHTIAKDVAQRVEATWTTSHD